MNYGYIFYFADGLEVLEFPITPGELKMTVGSKNETITLINEGDINLLKSPSLIDIEFKARFPMRQYPYARKYTDFSKYYDKFTELKEQKKSFRFVVIRGTNVGSGAYKGTWGTDLLVALESFDINENADEGDDVLITFKLKQYKNYGVKTLPTSTNKPSTSTSPQNREGSNSKNNPTKSETYKVKPGDCLWNIAKDHYRDGSKWTIIYNANKTVIENTANKYRKGKGSDNGHWIYPDTILTIPDGNSIVSSATTKTTSEIANYKKLTSMESRLDPK